MNGRGIHNLLPPAAVLDETPDGVPIDFDPRGKFSEWMDGQLDQLEERWANTYPIPSRVFSAGRRPANRARH